MAEFESSEGAYSAKVGLLFVFNLIIGTGALALPKSFQVAGYVSSVILINISAFTSFICATFVIECMAIANAAIALKRNDRQSNAGGVSLSSSEVISGWHYPYTIVRRTELTEMSKLFMNKSCLFFTYLVLVLYLLGDLTIYCATVSKSIINIICDPVNATGNESMVRCLWSSTGEYRYKTVYTSTVIFFAVSITPLVWIGVSRTKYLQVSTNLCRWAAFILMIVLASTKLMKEGAKGSPPPVQLNGFGPLFGTTVYAFMCHHSLPAVITPIRHKQHVISGIATVFIVIMLFYITLSMTGSYAFQKVMDVYTLNFLENRSIDPLIHKVLDYFLALFPVFTLSTNYPILGNTLANNLCVVLEIFIPNSQSSLTSDEQQSLLNSENENEESGAEKHMRYSNVALKRCCMLLVILLPMGISLITDNVLLLASITGSYPGVGVEYIIPSLLIIYARRYNKREFGEVFVGENFSPFKSSLWPFIMLTWSVFAIVMVTLNLLKAF